MQELVLPQSFPAGEYTPHGYLDNPYHSMVLNRSGVIRSVPPLGFGYWLRPFKGAYGSGVRGHVNYLSLLHPAVAIEDVRLCEAADFAAQDVRLNSRYHTKHMMSYDFVCREVACSLRYWLPREHTLACRVELRNDAAQAKRVTLHATHIYGLWESKWWGNNGLAARPVNGLSAAVSCIWAYGDYFALGADEPARAFKATTDRDAWLQWLRDNDMSTGAGATANGPGPMYAVMSYEIEVPARGATSLLLGLARGTNEPWSLEELETGLHQALPTLEQQLDEDEAFWGACPMLTGDWPEPWRRGWVYDYETLRMNVRRPLGMFAHPWDAMQVHSPRSVLGEAAVDMLALSYADPELAKQVLFGTFADAPMPNVPCTREDGSMNMIAADGEACGTAPSWCFPFHVIAAIYAATGDVHWIAALYPYMKAYLEWWFQHRTDEAGWFHCKCDWESGQDGSQRFPAAEGGSAENVRTVDVEAGVAEALRLMVKFAELADAPEDVPYWTKLAERRVAAVRGMFFDGWFHDIDVRTDQPIRLDYLDVMMLSPLTCGVASEAQVAALRPKFQHFRENPRHWLEWPSFMLALTEAAWTARMHREHAENIADIADRIYARTDAWDLRLVDADEPYAWRIPGVANEYWPLDENTPPGGEAYGWGATLPLHLIRGIAGFREAAALPGTDEEVLRFVLAPALPQRLALAGRRYGVGNLRMQELLFSVMYEVLDADRLRVTLNVELEGGGRLDVRDVQHGETFCEHFEDTTGTLTFDGLNGGVYEVAFTPGARR